ncbi:unnamed protein product, partial [Mesorhabditis spiculigera]
MIGWKCSGCIFGTSLWGVIFLAVLGGLYYNESIGLLEDIPEEEKEAIIHNDWRTQRVPDIKDKFRQNAYNAWIAAGAYGGLMVVSGIWMVISFKRS